MVVIGNSFPLNLVRTKVTIHPVSIQELRDAIEEFGPILSFWGHKNTVSAASVFLGHDLTPQNDRPALSLTPEGFPTFLSEAFEQCWILSPEYKANFRPAIGEEVSLEKILRWQVLLMQWSTKTRDH